MSPAPRTTLPEITLAPAACCAPLAKPDITPGEADMTSRLFKSLADPHRVRIVNLLANSKEPVCVCDLTAQLGLSQPTVSFHLKKLVSAGLLERESRGVWAYYSMSRDALRTLARTFNAKGGAR